MARLVSATPGDEDLKFDVTLRPRSLDEYVGQTQVKENLRVFIEAARRRGDPLDHVLLYGPPGLGKTTLAYIIANELGVSIQPTSGPAVERPIDLLVILKHMSAKEVLFIDEIHRLSRVVEEILYPAMEDFAFDRVLGKGPGGRSARIDLPPFTLVGATTRSGAISSPLRDRFGIVFHLRYYSPEDLTLILERSARLLGIEADPAGLAELACRSRGTPRIANRLLRRVRDFAQVLGAGCLDRESARQGLERLEIDQAGLDSTDRMIMECIIKMFRGGPVGLETLAAAVGEETRNLEEVYEPYLLQEGFLMKTPRGRMAAPRAYEHLGMEPGTSQSSLWE